MKESKRLTLAALVFLTASSFASVSYGGNNSLTTVTYTNLPRNLQFFARDNDDSAMVTFSGSLSQPGFDSAYIEVFRNNIMWKRKSLKLNYVSGTAQFNIGAKIYSELAEYKFKFYVKTGAFPILMKTADSLVCGDVYLVTGQSNAHPTNTYITYKNEYCRTFGVQTANYNGNNYNPADTAWGLSRADGSVYYFGGPSNVGIWALKLQELIKDNYGIPTCFINGGRAGSPISMHLRNESNPSDLTTTYGKLLYRVKKAGLADKIKAIFWYQGESDGTVEWVNYLNRFRDLYASWQEDYPGFTKLFLFQTRPSCSEQYASQLREVQRNIPDEFPNVELMATAGVPYYGGCHFGYQGYHWIADMVFRPLSYYYYGGNDTANMRPPDVRAVYYTSPARNEIAVLFNNSKIVSWPQDTLNQQMRNYFYLDGQTGLIQQGSLSGDTVKLRLYSPSSATRLTYLPTVWTHDDSIVYQGPFMKNPRNIGALSFHDFPINNYGVTRLEITGIVEGYYNLASNRLSIRDTLKVILKRNYPPYQSVDSVKIIIDSLTFKGTAEFSSIQTGTYYIVIKGSNILETWSKSPGAFITGGVLNTYNFTSGSGQAYGSNMTMKGSKSCFYSSDLNQDGIIDGNDNGRVSDDALSQFFGTTPTDLNGDRYVDGSDVVIVDHHSANYILKRTP